MDHRTPLPKLQRSGSLADVLKSRRKTCADVIRESKILINYEGLKSVIDTKRPETPLDETENYGNWKRIKSGDMLSKKSANVCFSPVSGIEFEIGSRPASSIKKLDPIDRKVRSASSGAKERNFKQDKLSAKPIEAFQNIHLKSFSAGPVRKSKSGSKLKRDCSANERDIKIKGHQNEEIKFFIEGKRCESITSPPKKSRQMQAKQKYENLGRQENDSKESGRNVGDGRRLARTEESKPRFPHEANKKPTNTIKINVTIPMPQVSSSSPLASSFDRNPSIRDSSEIEKNPNASNDASSRNVRVEGGRVLNSPTSSNGEDVFVTKSRDADEKEEKKFDGNDDDDDDDEEDEEEDERFVSMMLEDLKISSKVENAESLNLKMKTFHDELERRNLLGRSSKHRSKILKFIISLVDLDCQSLNLNVCKMMLALKVSGRNLYNVTKLLVKMSNDKKNVEKFSEENVIDIIMDTASCLIESSQSQSETIQSLSNLLVTINSLSQNSTTSKCLVTDVMANVIVSSFELAKRMKYEDQPEQCYIRILVLITSTSRNLLDVSNAAKILTNAGLTERLFKALDVSTFDESTTMNVVRVLSKLTMQSEYCSELSNASSIEALVNVMQRFYRHEDIILRVSFALGNLAARQDDCRLNYATVDEHLSITNHTYNHYLLIVMQKAKHLKESSSDVIVTSTDSDDLKALKKCEDIMVKLLRLVANLTLNEEVGSKVASEENLFRMILDTLDYERLTECDELFMNAMALLNNLSFYVSPSSALLKNQNELVRGLERFFFTNNESCLSDMIRVFGNMSRDEEARRNLTEVGVDRYLTELLDSESNEVVFSSCGALINFMADARNRIAFKRCSGVQRVIGVLETFGTNDWQLAGMACQILCNYCLGFEGEEGELDDECPVEALFLSEEILRLQNLLRRYLENPPSPSTDDPEMKKYFVEVWKSHFVNVAHDLSNKLDNYKHP